MVVVMFLGSSMPAEAGPVSTAKIPPKTTAALREFMLRFGSEAISLEILKSKERKPDWDAIGETVNEMDSVVVQMQKADKKNDYKAFTDSLSMYVAKMKEYSHKKNRKVFKVYTELSETCMQCHAAHRSPNYLGDKQ